MAITVTHDSDNTPMWSKRPLIEAVGSSTFATMLYELLTEKTPTASEAYMLELILKLSIDHGPDTPSTKAAIAEFHSTSDISKAVSAGIAKIDDVHGGAQESMMEIFYDMRASGKSAHEIVCLYNTQKRRLPGFGHRIYEHDPRAKMIKGSLRELKFPEVYLHYAEDVERELAKAHPEKNLPLNIDGAIAIALCTMDWRPEWSKPVFIIARSAGLCGHVINL